MSAVLLAAALALSPFAAGAQPASGDRAYVIERSLVTTIESADGHAYRLLLAWPEGEPPAAGWPVLYVLDGDDNFAVAAETARRLARAGGRSGVDAGVIVGIQSRGLPRRVLDYTPRVEGYAISQGLPAHGLATGGADAFLDFFIQRVQPFVAGRVRIDPARSTLAGHSFGGLLALHAMFTRPASATRFAAISPSLWFGGGDLMDREERGATASPAGLIAVGSDERSADGSAGSAAEALAVRLSARGGAVRYLGLIGQGHGTTMLAAMGPIVTLAFGRGNE